MDAAAMDGGSAAIAGATLPPRETASSSIEPRRPLSPASLPQISEARVEFHGGRSLEPRADLNVLGLQRHAGFLRLLEQQHGKILAFVLGLDGIVDERASELDHR